MTQIYGPRRPQIPNDACVLGRQRTPKRRIVASSGVEDRPFARVWFLALRAPLRDLWVGVISLDGKDVSPRTSRNDSRLAVVDATMFVLVEGDPNETLRKLAFYLDVVSRLQ